MNAHENANSSVHRLLNSPITGGEQAVRHLLKSTITDGYQMESHLIKEHNRWSQPSLPTIACQGSFEREVHR